jgi:hypothetical protein
VEGIDFTDVAALSARMDPWNFARGIMRQLGQIGGSRAAEIRGGALEGQGAVKVENVKTGSNFLYPPGLLLTSKELSSRSVE